MTDLYICEFLICDPDSSEWEVIDFFKKCFWDTDNTFDLWSKKKKTQQQQQKTKPKTNHQNQTKAKKANLGGVKSYMETYEDFRRL